MIITLSKYSGSEVLKFEARPGSKFGARVLRSQSGKSLEKAYVINGGYTHSDRIFDILVSADDSQFEVLNSFIEDAEKLILTYDEGCAYGYMRSLDASTNPVKIRFLVDELFTDIPVSQVQGYVPSWKYYRTITIPAGTFEENLTNFILTIPLSSSAGTGSTDLTSIFTELGSDMFKVKFELSDESELYTVVQLFQSGSTRGCYKVCIPTLDYSQDYTIYMSYDSGQADNVNIQYPWGDGAFPEADSISYNLAGDDWGLGSLDQSLYDIGASGLSGIGYNFLLADFTIGLCGVQRRFQGYSTYPSVEMANSWYENPTAFTLVCLFKFVPAIPGDTASYFLVDINYHNFTYLYVYQHKVWVECYDDSLTSVKISSASITENQWYMATVTWDGSNLKLYLDDALIGTETLISIESAVASSNFIGCSGSYNYNFYGYIEEVRVYDVAHSLEWVKANHKMYNDNCLLWSAEMSGGGA